MAHANAAVLAPTCAPKRKERALGHGTTSLPRSPAAMALHVAGYLAGGVDRWEVGTPARPLQRACARRRSRQPVRRGVTVRHMAGSLSHAKCDALCARGAAFSTPLFCQTRTTALPGTTETLVLRRYLAFALPSAVGKRRRPKRGRGLGCLGCSISTAARRRAAEGGVVMILGQAGQAVLCWTGLGGQGLGGVAR